MATHIIFLHKNTLSLYNRYIPHTTKNRSMCNAEQSRDTHSMYTKCTRQPDFSWQRGSIEHLSLRRWEAYVRATSTYSGMNMPGQIWNNSSTAVRYKVSCCWLYIGRIISFSFDALCGGGRPNSPPHHIYMTYLELVSATIFYHSLYKRSRHGRKPTSRVFTNSISPEKIIFLLCGAKI